MACLISFLNITGMHNIMQGETFGPLCCSVQVDSFGKECLDQNNVLYEYKGKVEVPPLVMVDDLVCISVCGINSVKLNAFINAKTKRVFNLGSVNATRCMLDQKEPFALNSELILGK